jgi:hypothetical protein
MQTPDTFRNSPMHNKSAILELMDELKPDQMMELVDYLQKSINNQHLLIVHHESGAELSLIDINNPDFQNASNIHDWRNYVPYDWRENWSKFTERERQIIAVMAQSQADKEDWD